MYIYTHTPTPTHTGGAGGAALATRAAADRGGTQGLDDSVGQQREALATATEGEDGERETAHRLRSPHAGVSLSLSRALSLSRSLALSPSLSCSLARSLSLARALFACLLVRSL